MGKLVDISTGAEYKPHYDPNHYRFQRTRNMRDEHPLVKTPQPYPPSGRLMIGFMFLGLLFWMGLYSLFEAVL